MDGLPAGVEGAQCGADRGGDGDLEDLVFGVFGGGQAGDQYEGPRIAFAVRSSSGRVRKSGR